MREKHTFEPVFDGDSGILILGSFPSVKSRETGFYYGHPQNRFWRVIAELFGSPVPRSIDEKRELILKNHLALWDVIQSCEITGSSDSSITGVIPNDLDSVLRHSRIARIVTNGNTAYRLYMKYQREKTGIVPVKLPSTSPANAAWSLKALLDEWRIINTLSEQ